MSETIYLRALKKWGKDAQMRMLQEECAELIVAINKNWRMIPFADTGVCEEIADVEIMIEQAKLIFPRERINEIKEQKLARLGNLLNLEEHYNADI